MEIIELFIPSNILKTNLIDSIAAKKACMESQDQFVLFDAAVGAVIQAYRSGGRLYIAGNGGSAADAQHLAAEFVSKLARNREPLPAEALTVDSSILTAIANDYGFSEIFSRQIKGKMTSKDIFLGITTSGQSENILRALETCNLLGIKSIVFSGNDGGKVKKLADYCIVAPGKRVSTIQEIHLVYAHTLCECVEQSLF